MLDLEQNKEVSPQGETLVLEMMTGPDLTGDTAECPGCAGYADHLRYCRDATEFYAEATPTEIYLENHVGPVPRDVPFNRTKHDKHWPDGTRRLVAADLGDDLHTFTRFIDRNVYDKDGEYIFELCIAYHMEYLDKKQEKHFAAFKGAVSWKPTNPISRNEPCPCLSGLKYKRCHLNMKPEPLTQVLSVEAHEEEKARLAANPAFQELSDKFAAGTLTQDEFYAGLGIGKVGDDYVIPV